MEVFKLALLTIVVNLKQYLGQETSSSSPSNSTTNTTKFAKFTKNHPTNINIAISDWARQNENMLNIGTVFGGVRGNNLEISSENRLRSNNRETTTDSLQSGSNFDSNIGADAILTESLSASDSAINREQEIQFVDDSSFPRGRRPIFPASVLDQILNSQFSDLNRIAQRNSVSRVVDRSRNEQKSTDSARTQELPTEVRPRGNFVNVNANELRETRLLTLNNELDSLIAEIDKTTGNQNFDQSSTLQQKSIIDGQQGEKAQTPRTNTDALDVISNTEDLKQTQTRNINTKSRPRFTNSLNVKATGPTNKQGTTNEQNKSSNGNGTIVQRHTKRPIERPSLDLKTNSQRREQRNQQRNRQRNRTNRLQTTSENDNKLASSRNRDSNTDRTVISPLKQTNNARTTELPDNVELGLIPDDNAPGGSVPFLVHIEQLLANLPEDNDKPHVVITLDPNLKISSIKQTDHIPTDQLPVNSGSSSLIPDSTADHPKSTTSQTTSTTAPTHADSGSNPSKDTTIDQAEVINHQTTATSLNAKQNQQINEEIKTTLHNDISLKPNLNDFTHTNNIKHAVRPESLESNQVSRNGDINQVVDNIKISTSTKIENRENNKKTSNADNIINRHDQTEAVTDIQTPITQTSINKGSAQTNNVGIELPIPLRLPNLDQNTNAPHLPTVHEIVESPFTSDNPLMIGPILVPESNVHINSDVPFLANPMLAIPIPDNSANVPQRDISFPWISTSHDTVQGESKAVIEDILQHVALLENDTSPLPSDQLASVGRALALSAINAIRERALRLKKLSNLEPVDISGKPSNVYPTKIHDIDIGQISNPFETLDMPISASMGQGNLLSDGILGNSQNNEIIDLTTQTGRDNFTPTSPIRSGTSNTFGNERRNSENRNFQITGNVDFNPPVSTPWRQRNEFGDAPGSRPQIFGNRRREDINSGNRRRNRGSNQNPSVGMRRPSVQNEQNIAESNSNGIIIRRHRVRVEDLPLRPVVESNTMTSSVGLSEKINEGTEAGTTVITDLSLTGDSVQRERNQRHRLSNTSGRSVSRSRSNDNQISQNTVENESTINAIHDVDISQISNPFQTFDIPISAGTREENLLSDNVFGNSRDSIENQNNGIENRRTSNAPIIPTSPVRSSTSNAFETESNNQQSRRPISLQAERNQRHGSSNVIGTLVSTNINNDNQIPSDTINNNLPSNAIAKSDALETILRTRAKAIDTSNFGPETFFTGGIDLSSASINEQIESSLDLNNLSPGPDNVMVYNFTSNSDFMNFLTRMNRGQPVQTNQVRIASEVANGDILFPETIVPSTTAMPNSDLTTRTTTNPPTMQTASDTSNSETDLILRELVGTTGEINSNSRRSSQPESFVVDANSERSFGTSQDRRVSSNDRLPVVNDQASSFDLQFPSTNAGSRNSVQGSSDNRIPAESSTSPPFTETRLFDLNQQEIVQTQTGDDLITQRQNNPDALRQQTDIQINNQPLSSEQPSGSNSTIRSQNNILHDIMTQPSRLDLSALQSDQNQSQTQNVRDNPRIPQEPALFDVEPFTDFTSTTQVPLLEESTNSTSNPSWIWISEQLTDIWRSLDTLSQH